MDTIKKQGSVKGFTMMILFVVNAIILEHAYVANEKTYWLLLITIPLLLIATWDVIKKKS